MLLLILATVATAFVFYYFIVKPYDYWKDRGVKHGKPIWVFGNSWKIISKEQSFAEIVQSNYNLHRGVRYYGTYQFFAPILVIRDPDLIKQVTVKDFDHFTDHRTLIPADTDLLWSKNLFALKGQKWRDMRAILSPSFTSSKMRAMFTLISECAENFTQHFLKKNEDIVTVQFADIFTRFTNDVIATTAFGIQIDSLREPDNPFYLMGKKATKISFWRGLKMIGYFFIPKLYKVLNVKLFSTEVANFFQQIVRDTLKVREEKGIVRPDMINLLLEARKGLQKDDEDDILDTGFSTAHESDLVKSKESYKEISDMDIAAQAMVFFLAGFDSVAGLMSFLAYELAANPNIQDKLREEVRTTLEVHDGKLTYDGLLKMKYLDMVVSETLRKWPISVATDRVCTKSYTIESVSAEEKPLHLEKDFVITLPIFGLHRDPEHFPDPERFDPERFSDENKGKIKPYTYFPFGLGPRNCIGSRFALMETKTVIFYILKHFELVPVEKSKIPLTISKTQFNMTSEDGFWFGLKRISH